MDKELQKENIKKDDQIFNSKEIVMTLHGLMNKVTSEKCNAETVNAACNCASKITDLLKLHLEVEKLKQKKESFLLD
jgi:hypothetical protein